MKKTFTIASLLFLALASKAQYNYLGPYTSDGLPLYLAPSDIISPSVMTMVKDALPESYPVPIYNPQYISSGYDTDIILTDSADVWVTFIDEGAGYKNVLGFYTYSLSAPLTSVPPSNKITMIFPNVSKLNSGGSLLAGNKVKIGSFPANTGIGFMLIANGWSNGAVGNGNWKVYSNPDFNPEANPVLRYHNVLIADTTNQFILLGFEDIRRDYGSCDNDFNDALFYVTADHFPAIDISNLAPIESANTAITSANSGGLESEGSLAQKIAKRNFKRDQGGSTNLGLKKFQQKLEKNTNRPYDVTGGPGPLSDYFPATGMFGNEVPHVSTPSDLIGITNATDVFSADYYYNSQRVSAGLATVTSGHVYNHTKAICDRLNNSSLEDVRTVMLGKYKLINSTLKNEKGETEYAITFSVQVLPDEYKLYSLWNVEQYPSGEYLNFQVWGSSMGQVCTIAKEIIKKLETEKTVSITSEQTQVPKVYIKKGFYKNGKLFLTICNKPKVKSILLTGNSTSTETGYMHTLTQNVELTGELYQNVEVNTGAIFDIGFSITYTNSLQQDGLYLADGAWGTDYSAGQAADINLKVGSYIPVLNQDKLYIERNPEVTGKIKGIVNLFRNAKAGNLPLDISIYKQVSFDIQSNQAAEIILVSDDLSSWENRARYMIAASPASRKVTIPLAAFTDNSGQPVTLSKIKTIVFSTNSGTPEMVDFKIKISNVNFNNVAESNSPQAAGPVVYPNPVSNYAVIKFAKELKSGSLKITDAEGKANFSKEVVLYNGEYSLDTRALQAGTYFFILKDNSGKMHKGKFIVKK